MAVSCWSSLTRAAEIRWLGASECRREAEVREQIESMTQRSLATIEHADFELEPQPLDSGAFQLQLTSLNHGTGARETRTLQGATCAEVTDAAAVAIALAVGSHPIEVTSAAASEPPPVTPTAEPAQGPPTDMPSPKALARTRWLVGVSGTFDSAAMPHPVPGGALLFAFEWRAFRAEVEAGAFAPSTKRDANERGGTFQLLYLAPRTCAAARVERPAVAFCMAYELGRLGAEGEGVARPYSRNTFWHAVRPELGVTWPLANGLWLSGRAGVALGLARDTFVLDEPEVVHRPPLLSMRAAAGLELEL